MSQVFPLQRVFPSSEGASGYRNSLKQINGLDDSARGKHRSQQDPASPAHEELKQPATPQESRDVFAAWTAALPSIRVVGRGGMEGRRHGGTAALQALHLSCDTDRLMPLRTGAGSASSSHTPFEEFAPCSPTFVPRARSLPSAAISAPPAAKLAGGAKAPKALAAQDSASSIGCMGARVQRLSLDSLTSPSSPVPLADSFLAGSATAATGAGLSGIERCVHGSSSFSALCEAAVAADVEAYHQPGSPPAVSYYKSTAPTAQQRLRRLDSGPLGGVLAYGLP